MHPYASQFATIFEGFENAYGVYMIKKSSYDESGKVKGKAASLVGEPTTELWSKHLDGEQGLGIIPINSNNKCRFGAIDVDDYAVTPETIEARVRKHGLPLVACRTKSGGVHLYCFTTDYIPATMMKLRLGEFASILGVGGSEIFPKQSELLVDRGDAGSWINMPYFGGSNTDRYAIKEGAPVKDIGEFLKLVQHKMVDSETLSAYESAPKDPLGKDAPPCLNCLCHQGFPEGTRNNGLMQLGVYAIMKNPDKWALDLDELNNKFMDPPLPSTEVQGVIKSLKKKEYRYMCSSQPMASYCNRNKCRTVKYGIGPSTGMPAMGTLTKYESSPPVWFIDIEGGGRIELTTDDLQNPVRFQKACMDQMNIMPPVLKRENWSEIVGSLLETVNIVHIPHESTPAGMLRSYLEDFINVKSSGHGERDKDILVAGNVWINQDFAHFRLRDFVDYLTVRRFNEFKSSKIAVILKDMKAEHVFFNIKGKGINCYKIHAKKWIQKSPFEIPKQNESII